MPRPVASRNGVAESDGRASVLSVARALRILELLASSSHGLRLAEIAASLGADRANALRILGEMEHRGFVFKDAISDRYKLTFLITALGFRHLEATGLSQWAQPILDRLAEKTREMVRMTVVEDGTLRWIARAQGANSVLIIDPDMGNDVVLHTTASGKAWLATLDRGEALRLVLRRGLDARTPHSITSAEQFAAELDRTAERGYGLAIEEGDLGVLAIAAPIWARGNDGTPTAVGTVSVAGPVPRVSREQPEGWAPDVIAAARLLGETWGPYVVTFTNVSLRHPPSG